MNMLRTLCLSTCLLACSLAVFPSAWLHSQPKWEDFGELSFPRGFHEALHIGDGKVLVLGESTTISRFRITGVPRETEVVFGLLDVGANPFRDKTRLHFKLPKASHILLTVSDMAGKEVACLVDERMERGENSVEWNASDLPPGTYLCRLVADGGSDSKLVIVK